MRILIEGGAECNDWPSRNPTTPLTEACRQGYLSIASLLIENGANIDKTDLVRNSSDQTSSSLMIAPMKVGYSPIARACSEGHENIVSLLIEKGANLEEMVDFSPTQSHCHH